MQTQVSTLEYLAWNFCLHLDYFSVQCSLLSCRVNDSLFLLFGPQLVVLQTMFFLCFSSLNCGLEIFSWEWAKTFIRLTLLFSHLWGNTSWCPGPWLDIFIVIVLCRRVNPVLVTSYDLKLKCQLIFFFKILFLYF